MWTAGRYSLGMAKFIQSASSLSTCPPADGPEIAFLGRSNSGKSSLINALLGQKLARVSAKPGRTRLLNFFSDSRRAFTLVDLPGYGFAKISKNESQDWKNLIESFLLQRQALKAMVLVVDIRRDWSPDEEGLRLWLAENRPFPLLLVLTKTDKLNRQQVKARLQKFQAVPGLAGIVAISNKKGSDLKELDLAFEKLIGTW